MCYMTTGKKITKLGIQRTKREQPSALTEKAPPEIEHAFHVAGIGASAGGLEALEQFFKNMPPDSSAAFVIVQHLDPTRKSLMPEILARFTKMPVYLAAEGMKVEANSIYLIPPDRYMGTPQYSSSPIARSAAIIGIFSARRQLGFAMALPAV